MSKVNTENLVGVTGAKATDVLGNVVWYSIGKGLITPKALREKLVNSGVGESWMPNPIRAVDAYRRATKFKKRVPSDIPNQYINYMVREVYADKELAIRHLVAETVDQDGKRLNYNSEAGRIILNKKDNSLKELIDSTELLNNDVINELSLKAKKRIIDDYNWDDICLSYEKIFKEYL